MVVRVLRTVQSRGTNRVIGEVGVRVNGDEVSIHGQLHHTIRATVVALCKGWPDDDNFKSRHFVCVWNMVVWDRA